MPSELDLTCTPFSDTRILTYEIELPPSGKKIVFNLLNDEDFTIPYVTDTIPNPPEGNQLPSQAKRNVWIIAINGEEPITYKCALDELNYHQTLLGKSKAKISLCGRKDTRRHVLKRSAIDLIKSYLYFHILKFVSQRTPPHQIVLVNFKRSSETIMEIGFICAIRQEKISAFFWIQSQ